MTRIVSAFALLFLFALPVAARGHETVRGVDTSSNVGVQLAHATLYSDVKVAIGPDGYPYLRAFRASDPQVSNASRHPMPELANLAIAQHCGIAVYDRSPTESKPLWVFSLGAVIALAEGDWRPTPADQSQTIPHATAGERIVREIPSNSVLPLEVRRALSAFMKTGGIAKPKVVAVLFMPPSGVPSRYLLIPNVQRSNYTAESDWIAELNRIAWFLPPTYDSIRPPDDDRIFAILFKNIQPLIPE